MADHPFYSAFTPFIRRFTDEKAREQRELAALYDEVGTLHRLRAISRQDVRDRILWEFRGRVPDPLEAPLTEALDAILATEGTVFDFPGGLTLGHLSLKEEVDLQRFLYAKKHYFNHQDKVHELHEHFLGRLVEGFVRACPELSEPSMFTIPYIYAVDDPKSWIEGLIAVLGEARYQENGVLTELYTKLHLNLCVASGISDPRNPNNKPWRLPTASTAPIAEIVDTYLQSTPFRTLYTCPIPLKLTHEDRFSHMHVVGGSGAGKTQLLQHIILHDLKSEDRPALVIIDSQSDLINKLSRLELFDPIEGIGDKFLLITPRDIQHPPALNIFDVNQRRLKGYGEAVKEQVTAGVIQTFDYLFTGLLGADLTAKQDVFFKFVARLMLAIPETMGRNATILDMVNLMDDMGPYETTIAKLPPIQKNFFERDFRSKTFAQTREQIRYRLNAILENPTLARLFTSPKTKVDLFTALNEQNVILVDTSKEFLKGSSPHFGRIFISLVLQAILERAAIPEHERKPAFLVVDEAANYFDSNMDDLLTEARKYKLGCVFAHQFLDQASNGLKSSLAANTSIKMASGISTGDARALAPEMRTTPDFILNQAKLSFAAYIRGVTPTAVSIPVRAGELEREPTLESKYYQYLQNWNRSKVSLSPEELAELKAAEMSAPVAEPTPTAGSAPKAKPEVNKETVKADEQKPDNPDRATKW